MTAPNWFIGWPFDTAFVLDDVPARVRRFAPTDLHVTSVFLGAVDETTAERAWAIASARPGPAVDVTLGEVRLLGGRNPTAISAIVADNAALLTASMTDHRARLVDAGLLGPDKWPPLPHVTMARIQRSASPDQRAAALQWVRGLRVDARARLDRFALYTWSDDRRRQLFRIHKSCALEP